MLIILGNQRGSGRFCQTVPEKREDHVGRLAARRRELGRLGIEGMTARQNHPTDKDKVSRGGYKGRDDRTGVDRSRANILR